MSHQLGDFSLGKHKGESPYTEEFLCAKSTLCWPNSLVVVSEYTGAGAAYCTIGSQQVIRPLLAADLTAHYAQTGSIGDATTCGVLGCCVEGWYSDANFAAVNQIDMTSTYKAALANVIDKVPSMGLARPPRQFVYSSTTYTASAFPVIIANDTTEFWMRMYSTNTATELTLGDEVGFDIAAGTSATSRTIRHQVTVNPGATDKIAVVTGFDDNDDTRVLVRILPAWQQHRMGYRYSAQ